MKLILTEKPSVAKEVASYLNCKMDDSLQCLSNGEYLVTNAIGHLFAVDPESMGLTDDSKEFIVPNDLILKESKGDQIKLVTKLMKMDSVDSIYIFTDPDPEGERIAWDIINEAKIDKPTYRLWTSDVLSKGLVDSLLKSPEPSSKYYPYYQSSKLRAYTDVVLGYNLTKGYVGITGRYGSSIGRCQTPILSEICKRYIENTTFTPELSYKVRLTLTDESGRDLVLDSTETFKEKLDLQLEGVDLIPVLSEIEEKSKYQSPLYDKGSLIVDANRKYKIKADEVSKILQDTYQNMKITSYPRTPSRFLDEKSETKARFYKIISDLGYSGTSKDVFSKGKLLFDNKKLKSHHALIILNGEKAMTYIKNNKNENTAKVLELIRLRMLTRAADPIKYNYRNITLSIPYGDSSIELSTSAKSLVDKGYLVYDDSSIGNYTENEWMMDDSHSFTLKSVEYVESWTKAPPLYTSGSILEWMKSVGIGTPATIDSYVPLLVSRHYIQVDKLDHLIPTPLGRDLIDKIKSQLICKPELTSKMEEITEKVVDSDDSEGFNHFKSEVDELIRELYEDLISLGDDTPHSCLCGSTDITSSYMSLECNSCGRKVNRFLLKSRLSNSQMSELLAGREVFVYNMISKRTGRKFSCKVKFTTKIEFVFN